MNNKEIFKKYEKMLIEWSERMNLVAPSTLSDVQNRHILDCIQLADVMPPDVSIIDLGSGAGFPAAIMAIQGWDVVAIESVGKKTAFLNAIRDEFSLDNFTVFNGRVEEYVKTIKKTNREIVFTARAFASVEKILDYVGKTKFRLFLLKGREVESEIKVAKQKYKFDYKLIPSRTGDGFITIIYNIK